MGEAARLNLPAIETSLREVKRSFDRINARLKSRRDPMSDEVLGNMLTGYAFVDRLLADRVELFTLRHFDLLLEINSIVLCGTRPEKRAEFDEHLRATEERFYEERDGGIKDLMEWYAMNAGKTAWDRAAGSYVRILSKPQLFIEGNHRSGALVISYILASAGQPPFVLSVENAAAWFEPSAVIRDTRKKGAAALFRIPAVRRNLANFLRSQAKPGYLLACRGDPGMVPASLG